MLIVSIIHLAFLDLFLPNGNLDKESAIDFLLSKTNPSLKIYCQALGDRFAPLNHLKRMARKIINDPKSVKIEKELADYDAETYQIVKKFRESRKQD